MKTPTKFVKQLSETQRAELQQVMKTGNEQTRRRAHAVLLSAREFSVDEIADIYEVDRDTVSSWLARWENNGAAKLPDQAGRGRKPLLNAAEQKQAIKIVEAEPRAAKQSLAKIEEKTGKKISRATLVRILKAGGKVWKRLRRSVRAKRDDADFQAAQAELAEFRALAATGAIDHYYYDEASFTLDPCVPYAWQTRGETLELPATRGGRLSVLGFCNTANQMKSFVFADSIDSDIVIACFDDFCLTLTKPTIVVIDGSSTHVSAAFQAKLPEWEARDLYVYLLPAYSPELNLIEIVWRMMKYHWLPLWAYRSFDHLLRGVIEVLQGIGSKYQVNFAC